MTEDRESKIFVPDYAAKYGYLDTSGNIVISPKYKFGAEFQGGLALVVEDKHFSNSILGIDESGKILFTANGKKYTGTIATLSTNSEASDEARLYNLYLPKGHGEAHEVIDGSGNLFWPHVSTVGAKERFTGWQKRADLVRCSIYRGNFSKFFERAEEYGFSKPQVDGQIIRHALLPSKFSEGLSHTGLRMKDGHYEMVLVNDEGHLVAHLAPEVLEVADFHEERAAVRMFHPHFDANGDLRVEAIGFIGPSGEIAISPRYDANIGWKDLKFGNGLCPVSKDKYFGAISRDGKVVIDFRYTYMRNFSEGLAAVSAIVSKDGVVIDARMYKSPTQDWKSVVEYVLTLLNKNLSSFKSAEPVRFSFHINHKYDPQISFQTESAPEIKQIIESTWREIVLPAKGFTGAPDGRANFILCDGKVNVALSRNDPQIAKIVNLLKAKFREFHSGVKEDLLNSSESETRNLIDVLGFGRSQHSYHNLLPSRRVWVAL